MPGDASAVQEFSDDATYFAWLAAHPTGYLLSVRGRSEPLVHRTDCSHIDRHNNAGALTERGSRKLCATNKDDLRAWVRQEGLGPGNVLKKCPTCSPCPVDWA